MSRVAQASGRPLLLSCVLTERLQDIADRMLTYELIDEEFDVSTVTGG
jgi:hypothetical protein